LASVQVECWLIALYFNNYIVVIYYFFFFSSRRRHTRSKRDWSSDVCSSDLGPHIYWFGRWPPLGVGMCRHGPVLSAHRQNHCGGSFYTGTYPTVYRSGPVGIQR